MTLTKPFLQAIETLVHSWVSNLHELSAWREPYRSLSTLAHTKSKLYAETPLPFTPLIERLLDINAPFPAEVKKLNSGANWISS
jgi:hypothetical protein